MVQKTELKFHSLRETKLGGSPSWKSVHHCNPLLRILAALQHFQRRAGQSIESPASQLCLHSIPRDALTSFLLQRLVPTTGAIIAS